MAKSNTNKIIAKAGRQDIKIVREFDAPCELVFKAHVEKELYGKWLGPSKFNVVFEKFEPRNGGSWRYIFKQLDGPQLCFNGVYHLVKAPEKIIGSFEYEGEQGYVILNSSTFETLPGNRTKLTIQSVFQSVEERDAELTFLTEEGLEEMFVRLDNLLKNIK